MRLHENTLLSWMNFLSFLHQKNPLPDNARFGIVKPRFDLKNETRISCNLRANLVLYADQKTREKRENQ